MRLLSLKVILSFVKKEFIQIRRTRELLFLVLGAPIIQVVVLGFAVTNEVKHIKLFVDDRDNTAITHQLRDSFAHTDRFDLVQVKGSETPDKLIEEWKAQIVIVIPPGFTRDLAAMRKPEMQILTDGLDANSAGVAAAYAQGIMGQFISDKTAGRIPPSMQPVQVGMQERMWYNEDLNSAQYMIPGIIVILVTIISMMLSSMSLVKEKEIGTLEQLMVTPVKKTELLLGKLIPYWLLALVEMLLVTLAAHIIFGIHFAGSVFTLGLLAALYLLTTLGLGIFVSTMADTQQQAMFFSWFMMVFMLLLSGLFVPIRNMPEAIKEITLLNPMRYFMTITRSVMIKGSGIVYLWKEAGALLIYGLTIFGFSVAKFHKTAS